MLRTLRVKMTLLVLLSLILCVGGSYSYIIGKQSAQFVETTKDQASVLTHTIVRSIQHDFSGACTQDIQGIFERIGVIPDIESLRIFNEDGKVTKSWSPEEVGLTIEDIGYEIFMAGNRSSPYLGGEGYNAFCMVEPIRNEESCRICHAGTSEVLGIFELCLSMQKTDIKVAENRRFLIYSALFTIAVVGLAITLLFTFQVNRPVGKIVRAMGEVEGGDLSVRANLPRQDELGAIGRSLNSMIEQLDSSRREIEAYHTDQLIRAERLASIGELAASVAHEIKNPLAGISGAVQVLSEDYPPGDPRREVTDQVLSQCSRMDKTIKDLLDYAQPLRSELSAVNVNEVLDRSLFIAVPNPSKSPVRIHRRYREDLPRAVGDAKLLEQVFLNLFLNAIQSMPEGGDLTVKTALRDGEQDMIEVEVRDTGGGIPEDVREKIFSPFFTPRTRGSSSGAKRGRARLFSSTSPPTPGMKPERRGMHNGAALWYHTLRFSRAPARPAPCGDGG
jgi:signal transduction histidine kinase